MENIFLSIFSSLVEIQTDSGPLAEKLKKDFAYFLASPGTSSYRLKCFLQDIPWGKIPPLAAKNQSLNSITYENKGIRYNDYHGEALSIYNYGNQQGEIYSLDPDLLHEVSYLMILSRTGKKMDLSGFHKIHACGVANDHYNFIAMMPMKGGKTTLFLNLIKDQALKIISDDGPVVDRRGKIHSFPLRVGVEEDPGQTQYSKLPSTVDRQKIYRIHRKKFGPKFLIPMTAFQNPLIGPGKRKNILCQGIRTSTSGFKMVKVKKRKMLFPLMTHLVVGLGLPMVIEYFLESGINDHFRRLHILTSRLWAATRLLMGSDTYFLYLGKDIDLNVEGIRNFMNTKAD